jgi:hypothetical protein
MPIYTPSSPTTSASKPALPYHPISPSQVEPPCPKHPLHHPTLSAPPFPPPERRDSCHRHLNVNDDEWADSAASWHNREWADSDFVAPSKSTSGPNTSDDPTYQPLNHLHGGVLMGPCTCRDGSLHDHSKPVTVKSTVHENGEGIDPIAKQEERIEDARRHLLFGNEKVDEKVMKEAVGVLRESENRIGH